MSYEHDLVERAVLALGPQEPSFESLLLRRDRKRRNQRLAAGAVGLAIGIGVMILASAFLRSAANRETGEWPSPPFTSTRLVQPGEVLLSPYPSDAPTSVVAVDVSTGARRSVDGCPGRCGVMSQFNTSADRGWIAYNLRSCEECRPVEPESGLWVVGAEMQARLVLPVETSAWGWSPTGAQLAYADVDELILLDPTTWERTTIATAGGAVSAIAWGPDGRSIAYSVEPLRTVLRDAPSGVFVVRSGSEPVGVSDALGTSEIGWSPDGGFLVLNRAEDDRSVIEVMRADGSEKRVLVEGPGFEGPGEPVWSPDGSRIAFMRTPGEPGDFAIEFWVIGADGRGEVRGGVGDAVTWLGGGPVWSPDSQRIAWSLHFGSRWVVADADGGDSPQPIDRLVAERWRQG